MAANAANILDKIGKELARNDVPDFRVGDTIKVHAKIVEGSKERIQMFEGVVIKRHNGARPSATFTVRKISYNIGVERTFFLHSPRIDKIEILTHGSVRRARLFYLRPLRGKAARIRARYVGATDKSGKTIETAAPVEIAEDEAADGNTPTENTPTENTSTEANAEDSAKASK